MELPLRGGAQRARDADRPHQHELGRRRDARPVAPAEVVSRRRGQRGGQRGNDEPRHLRLQTPRPGELDALPCEIRRERDAHERAPPVEAAGDGNAAVAARVEDRLQQHVDHDAPRHRDQAHRERRVEAVPDREAELGERAADDRTRRGVEERPDRPRRRDPDDEAREHEQLDRHAHPAHRLVRLARQVVRPGAEEDVDRESKRVDDREEPGQRGDDRQRELDAGMRREEVRLREEHLLRQEPVQQRHPGHRGARHQRQRPGDRHHAVEPVQAPDIPGPGLVVDDARRHEERRLERRVVHHVEDRRHRGERA
ncbi:MAG: hypothetical protein IPG84_03415, partial [Betaproteobacteria bacterium]|nr:hypothetical protein [Betaproteobacteria bacterium]